MKRRNITNSELVIMNALWEEDGVKTLMEILATIHDVYGKDWKVQTVSTFLKRLVEKGYVSFYRQGRQYYYRAEKQKDECFTEEVQNYATIWQHTPSDFVLAFSRGGKLDEKEIQRLKDLIEEMEE